MTDEELNPIVEEPTNDNPSEEPVVEPTDEPNDDEPIVNPLIVELGKRIPYDEDIHGTQQNYEDMLNSLLNDSEQILLGKLFPFEDFSNYAIPPQYNNWLIRCCVELYNLADKQGITAYAENGLSWTKLSDGLSHWLMNQIIPRAGIPKRCSIIREPIVEEDDGE